jgi:hypothetical protein
VISMRFNNVIAITAHLFVIIVLDSTVFILPISKLNVTRVNTNPLSLLNDMSNLVNTLRATKAYKVREM